MEQPRYAPRPLSRHIEVPDKLWKKVGHAAVEAGITKSEFVRQAISEKLGLS